MTQTAGNLTHDNTTNAPPLAKAETLEDQVRGRHAEFLRSAQMWIDSVARAPEVIPDDAINEKIGKTVQELIKARTKAETHHKAEKAPFLDSGRVIDYIFLTGVSKAAQAAQTTLENRQRVFLRKKQAEETARLAVEAEKQQLEQEAELLASELALRAAERAQDRGDFQAADEALETAVAHKEAAQTAQAAADAAETRAERPVQDMLRVHSSLGVTISGKTEYVTTFLGDRSKVDWTVISPYISDENILKAAKAVVKAGRHEISGFKIEADIKPINR